LLLRWHIFRPAHVVKEGKAGEASVKIVEAAGLTTKPVKDWVAADEVRLIDAFLEAAAGTFRKRVSDSFRRTLSAVITWSQPEWNDGAAGPSLHRIRDFKLFIDGIPFPDVPVRRRKGVKPSNSGRRIA
jgi:hypothetical protein